MAMFSKAAIEKMESTVKAVQAWENSLWEPLDGSYPPDPEIDDEYDPYHGVKSMTWGAATGGTTITHIALYDSANGGHIIAKAPLKVTQAITPGMTFNVQDMTFTIT